MTGEQGIAYKRFCNFLLNNFSLQTLKIFIPHLILNIFAVGSKHLEPTVKKMKVGQVQHGQAAYTTLLNSVKFIN